MSRVLEAGAQSLPAQAEGEAKGEDQAKENTNEKKESLLPGNQRNCKDQKVSRVTRRILVGVTRHISKVSRDVSKDKTSQRKPKYTVNNEDQDETTCTKENIHNHFNIDDSRSARFGSAGV